MNHEAIVTNLFKKPNGFSLLEILIALVIFSISFLALASLMGTATMNSSFGGHMTEAATFAQDKFEELKANSWDDIVSGGDQKTGPTGINYARNWSVVERETGNLKTVSLTISWKDRIDHSISLFTVISQ